MARACWWIITNTEQFLCKTLHQNDQQIYAVSKGQG